MASESTHQAAEELQSALDSGNYDDAIVIARQNLAAHGAQAMSEPVMQDWLGRRYRNIFLDEAEANAKAISHSQAAFPLSLIDSRSNREKVGKRMFTKISRREINAEMPPAKLTDLGGTTLVFAPGLLTGLLPNLAFESVWPVLINRFRLRIGISDSHPMRSTEANVADLENVIERGIGVSPIDSSFITAADSPLPPKDVVLIGYSKGMPDILTLLVQRPDLVPRIKAIVSWAGASGGSYLANGIYEKIKDVPQFDTVKALAGDVGKMMLRLAPVIQINNVNRRLDEYDIKGGIQSLTTEYRQQFNAAHQQQILDYNIPMFNFTGSTHLMEVPYYQRKGTLELLAYDKFNDMQLTQEQAQVPDPKAPRLAMFHANHWDLSYDTFPWYTTLGSSKLKDPFAREAAMTAIVVFLAELGLLD